MRDRGKLDTGFLDFFLTSGFWKEYARRHLQEGTEGIDIVPYRQGSLDCLSRASSRVA